MEFLQENYVFILIGLIVVLMAFIGYYADKTDFGRNRIKKDFKKTKEKPQKIEIENKGINDINKNIAEESKNEINVENSEIDQSLFAPLNSEEQPNNETNNVGQTGDETQTNTINEEVKEVNSEEQTSNENEHVDDKEEDIWKF